MKIKYGISNVYYSVVTETVTSGVISYSYATPVALPGAVSLSVDAEGGNNPFYADNIVYYESFANNGYTGDLEIADIPASFRKDVLGEVACQSKTLAEYANVAPKQFALAFQVETDEGIPIYFWFYNCTAARPTTTAATKEDAIDPQTDTISITMRPRAKDALVRLKSATNTQTSITNTWYSAVIEPIASTT